MLAKLADIINRRALAFLLIGLAVVAACGAYGSGVFPKLSGGGFQDSASESTAVSNAVEKEFGKQQVGLVALFTSSSLAPADPEFKAEATSYLAGVSKEGHVTGIASYYSSGQRSMLSKDGLSTYAALTLSGSQNEQQDLYKRLVALPAPKDLTVRYGGSVAVTVQINDQISKDLAHAESLSFPILVVMLIIFFGSVTSGLIPPIIGGLSIAGALFIVRVLTSFTDISIYSINVIILLGLGLAVDYSLFIISRFREELNQDKTVPEALHDTMQSAGRTVFFSGSTVILSLLSLLVFPQGFLKSMGLGGAAAVIMSMILAVTILPAILRLLGRRVNSLPVPFIGRSLESKETKHGMWYKFSYWVMHRPVWVLCGTLALLLLLGAPFLRVQFSTTGVSSVPTSFDSRQVSDALSQNFGDGNNDPDTVLVHAQGNPLSAANIALVRRLETQLEAVQGVTGIQSVEQQANTASLAPDQAADALASPAAAGLVARYVSGSDLVINAYQKYEPQSPEARDVMARLRGVTPPAGLSLQVGGTSAQLADLLGSLERHIGYALAIASFATAVLLFLMLGSVVIPIKAVIINFLSLIAAFGVLVWVFQGGHLAGIGIPASGSIDATEPVLIFAIAFGLAMDYELFLLSRIKENYEKTHDNVTAVATGVQKTASIITSAALLMVIVIGLFATGKISLIQQIGVGLGMAVLVDATVVRMLLVPAAMRLMGDWNWWAPQPLARLSEKLGLKES